MVYMSNPRPVDQIQPCAVLYMVLSTVCLLGGYLFIFGRIILWIQFLLLSGEHEVAPTGDLACVLLICCSYWLH